MRFKIFMMTVLALGLAMATALAADVTGTWFWKGQGQGPFTPSLELNLKADGNNLTGTVALTTGEPVPISEGKIDGDNISILAGGTNVKIIIEGKVTGDEMELTINFGGAKSKRGGGSEGGERPTIVAKRQK